MHNCKEPPPDKFYVVSHYGLEATRTSRRAAEDDVSALATVDKFAWVSDIPPSMDTKPSD